MPSDREVMEYIRQGMARGIPREQLEATLKLAGAKKETYPFGGEQETETNFRQVAPGRVEYGTREEGVESMTPDQFSKGLRRFTVGNVLPIAAMEAAPLLLPAKIAARPLIGMMSKIGLRSGGAGLGGEASAVVEGEKPSLERGLHTARNVALMEGLVRLPAYATARAGSVEPVAASLAQDNPGLLKPVHAKEYASAVEDIAKTRIPPTAEHAAYETLVANRGKVDGLQYAQRIFDKVRTNVDEPMARLIERKTDKLANSLLDRLDNDGMISARDLDDWIRVNLTEPAAQVYERGAGTAWKERLATLRNDITPRFYDDVGAAVERRAAGANRPVVTLEEAARFREEGEIMRRLPGDSERTMRAKQKGMAFKEPPTPAELEKARATPTRTVGPSAAELQKATSVKLGKVNAAKNMFPMPTEASMNLQSPAYLRQVLKDTDLGEQVRTRLAGLDEVAGTKHLPRVKELAMRDSWTAAEKAEVEDILANVPAIAYERVGLVRAGSRKLSRLLTRSARPVGRVTAVGSNIRGVSQ